MVTIIAPRLYVRDITEQFDFGDDTDKIKKIEEVYLYDANYFVGQSTRHHCAFLYMTAEFAKHVEPDEYEALYEKYVWHDGVGLNVPVEHTIPAVFLPDEAFEDIAYGKAFEQVADYYRHHQCY